MNHLISTKHTIIHGERDPSLSFVRHAGHGARSWGATPKLATREMLAHVSPTAIGPLDWPTTRAQRGFGQRFGPVSIARYQRPVPLLGTYWPGFPRAEPDEPEQPPTPGALVDEICALIAKLAGVPNERL